MKRERERERWGLLQRREENRESRDYYREERTQDSDKDFKISGRESSPSIARRPEISFLSFPIFLICNSSIRVMCARTVAYFIHNYI